MAKQIVIGPEAREKVVQGITKLADAVTSTLGPNGRNVLYSDGYSTYSTKDGVTVAKNIEFSDPFEQIGVSLIKLPIYCNWFIKRKMWRKYYA